jgi:hypothetical protein
MTAVPAMTSFADHGARLHFSFFPTFWNAVLLSTTTLSESDKRTRRHCSAALRQCRTYHCWLRLSSRLHFPTRGCISLANSFRNFLDILLNMAVRRNTVGIVDVEFYYSCLNTKLNKSYSNISALFLRFIRKRF